MKKHCTEPATEACMNMHRHVALLEQCLERCANNLERLMPDMGVDDYDDALAAVNSAVAALNAGKR